MATVKSQSVPRTLQLWFMGVLLGGVALQAGETFYAMWQQSATNTNFSGFVPVAVGMTLLPVVMVVAAYALNPRTLSMVGRWFEAFLLAVVGSAIGGIVTQLLWQAGLFGVFGDNFVMAELWMYVAQAVLFVVTLYGLRSSGRWK